MKNIGLSLEALEKCVLDNGGGGIEQCYGSA